MIKALAATLTTLALIILLWLIGSALSSITDEAARHQQVMHLLDEQRAAFDLAEQQRQALVTQDARDTLAVSGYTSEALIVALLPLVALLGLYFVWRAGRRATGYVWPRENGLLPVTVQQLPVTAPGALGAHHQTELARATAPALLQKSAQLAKAPDEIATSAIAAALPGLTTLGQILDTGWRPSREGILLGLQAGGKQIVAPVGDSLCHIVFAGRTGVGKSNLSRLILTQLIAAGSEVYLLDPHFAAVDRDTGDDWRAIAAGTRLGKAVTSDEEIMLLLLEATQEIQRRLDLRAVGQPYGSPRFYMIDEAPRLAGDKEFMRRVGVILREARKVKIFVALAAQDLLTSTLQTTGGVRSQFATCYCGGGDATTTRALLGKYSKGGDWPEPPGKGVLYLKAAAMPVPDLVRVPLVSNGDIERLLGPGSLETMKRAEPEATNYAAIVPDFHASALLPSLPGLSEREVRVRDLLRAGVKFGDVLKQEWGVSGGRAYADASNELSAIIGKLVGG